MADILKLIPNTGGNLKEVRENLELVGTLFMMLLASLAENKSPLLGLMAANLHVLKTAALGAKLDRNQQKAIEKAVECIDGLLASMNAE